MDRVVFRNEENSFTVIELNCGGELVTAVGSLPELSSGEEISLYGTWDSHTLFGRQFKASQIERKMPETASQLYGIFRRAQSRASEPKPHLK